MYCKMLTWLCAERHNNHINHHSSRPERLTAN
uniref:Uncharacterized protein n=1 Tax=Anguilla anguilla TaxID=7936 RepID=A0A0E9VHK8_ANGAN